MGRIQIDESNTKDSLQRIVQGLNKLTAPDNDAAYTTSNVTTGRSFDADATSVAELADVLGTLIALLKDRGIIK